ncbi:MAG: extracellular solute-binding protein [Chlamydiales bacterium]|nr:extracellular solute-binding protein [Chlamydiales bacterium]
MNKNPRLSIRIFLCLMWVMFIFSLLYIPKFNTSKSESTLNVFTWGDIFTEELIHDFEKETGIKVHLNFYDSNEELLVKLKSMRGKGHDLIIPSDYAVKILIEEEMIQPLEKSKLDFLKTLEPSLLGHDYDPKNTYTLPLQWDVYGLSYDGEYFDTTLSWKQVFEDQPYTVAMTNDAIEAFNIASFYLHGNQNDLSDDQVQATRALMKKQKKRVEAYANYRAGYLIATKNCPLAVTSSSFHYRMAKDFPFIRFAIPKEGSFITVENIAIPTHAQNKAAAYHFLNYIYRPDVMTKRSCDVTTFPAIQGHLPDINDEYLKNHAEALKRFNELHFYRILIPEQALREIWVDVKS